MMEKTPHTKKVVINVRLFVIRLITAISLFAVLGKANVWLDTTANSILALGYRALLLLLPLTIWLIGERSLRVTLLCSAVGLILLAQTKHQFIVFFGTALFAFGIAIAGYLIKNEATQTKQGAAYNRVAMNIGSLIAGFILFIPQLTPFLFFNGAACLILFCFPIASGITIRRPVVPIIVKKVGCDSWLRKFPWVIAGIIMGIKLFGVFSILPQEILKETGELSPWYGLMLILNSAVVVLLQIPVMRAIEATGRFKVFTVIGVIFVGFLVLSSPALFKVHNLMGAFIWVSLLSIAECAFSHLDYYSVQQNSMFIKEVSIGIGAGLTVLLMRTVPNPYNAYLLGFIGAFGIVVWYVLNQIFNAPLHE